MSNRVSPVREQLLREAEEMVSYALSSGIAVPAAVLHAVESFAASREKPTGEELAALAGAHQRLCKLVAPATPRALVIFAEQASDNTLLGQLGPVKLVRQMMLVALGSLLCFIFLNTAHYWMDSVREGSTRDLLLGEFLWLAAASLGAAFSILFQVNDFIVQRNYDPKYEPSYWIKFILGAIAGFILAALIPVESLVAGGTAAQQAGGAAGEGAATREIATTLAKPTLALLGGYSASVVYRILDRLVTAVESLFRGDPREEMAAREQSIAARYAEESSQSRLAVASRLVELRSQLATGGSAEEISRQVNEIVRSLLPATEDPTPTPASRPAGASAAPPERTAGAVPVPAMVGEGGTVVTAPANGSTPAP